MQPKKEETKPVRIKIGVLEAIEKEAIATSLERGSLVQVNELVHEFLEKELKARRTSKDR
jgi:Zn finger protein HypA/HybF involved in hydrogenase expression